MVIKDTKFKNEKLTLYKINPNEEIDIQKEHIFYGIIKDKLKFNSGGCLKNCPFTKLDSHEWVTSCKIFGEVKYTPTYNRHNDCVKYFGK